MRPVPDRSSPSATAGCGVEGRLGDAAKRSPSRGNQPENALDEAYRAVVESENARDR